MRHEGRENADQYSSIFGLVIAGIVAMVSLLVWLWRKGSAAAGLPGELTDAALRSLARAQTEQWKAEETARGIRDPWLLPVRWHVSPRARAVMASWASVMERPGARPLSLDGAHDQLAEVLTKPGSLRRLVVVGEPGAGKSILMLQLALQLLKRRVGPDPVPVLLPIAGWNPDQPLDDWIAERVAADTPSLARAVQAPDGTWRTLARDLVADGRIMPILDGLDEIAPAQHSAALAAIAASAGAGQKYVITSRTEPYEAAVKAAGSLAHAAVVELQPLSPNDVARYLVEGSDQTSRWNDVAVHLTSSTDTPLTNALSTPLMVWLARTVYRHPATDPAQLLEAPWAIEQAGIERHLLGKLVAAVYTTAVGKRSSRTPAEAEQARRRLAGLARLLQRQRTYDLAWWRLSESLPRGAIQIVSALAIWPIVGLVVGLAAGLDNGADVAIMAGLESGPMAALFTALALTNQKWGHASRMKLRRLPGRRVFVALLFGSTVGLAAGLLTWRALDSMLGFAIGSTMAVIFTFVTAVTFTGGRDERAVSPVSLLAEDRTATLVDGAMGGLAAGLVAGLAFPVPQAPAGLPSALAAGLTVALMYALPHAWGIFVITRAGLAMSRTTPLRLMVFLREAHDRGVLRQAGGVYQFRHSRLQDHLADPTTP
ncbi:NACHT domain-containing NTPase [Micromonospora sp. H61]|uniref:NACHT domain-containing protein n=1 Tax=Micromonospora sp. H61 TaxID=2824888 RepID=UPI001B3882BE|nr:NACHT domain-containing protein [Micromonospora sp. H61]